MSQRDNRKSCHSDQLSRKLAGFRHSLRHSFVYVARLSAKIRRLAEICGLGLGTQQLDVTPLAPHHS
jgi:hypothetical protein